MAAQQQAQMPQGAQIPLQNFNIPQFPPQANSLKSLTLTSEIKLADYQPLLKEPHSIPPLPYSIESLTLELFSLGYPAGFLLELARKVPNVKSLVFFSQLLGGLTDEGSNDAVALFKYMRGLRGLHLLDVFAKPGLLERIAPFVIYDTDEQSGRRGLMFLEVNYTTQQGDDEVLSKVPAKELPKLIGPGLITLTFNASEAEDDEDEAGAAPREGLGKDGVMTFNKSLSTNLVKALSDDDGRPQGLRVLNTTLYTLTFGNLKTILTKQTGLMVLMITLEVDGSESCRKQLLEVLSEHGQRLEQVEIVVSPSMQFFMEVRISFLTCNLHNTRLI